MESWAARGCPLTQTVVRTRKSTGNTTFVRLSTERGNLSEERGTTNADRHVGFQSEFTLSAPDSSGREFNLQCLRLVRAKGYKFFHDWFQIRPQRSST